MGDDGSQYVSLLIKFHNLQILLYSEVRYDDQLSLHYNLVDMNNRQLALLSADHTSHQSSLRI